MFSATLPFGHKDFPLRFRATAATEAVTARAATIPTAKFCACKPRYSFSLSRNWFTISSSELLLPEMDEGAGAGNSKSFRLSSGVGFMSRLGLVAWWLLDDLLDLAAKFLPDLLLLAELFFPDLLLLPLLKICFLPGVLSFDCVDGLPPSVDDALLLFADSLLPFPPNALLDFDPPSFRSWSRVAISLDRNSCLRSPSSIATEAWMMESTKVIEARYFNTFIAAICMLIQWFCVSNRVGMSVYL